MAQSLHFSYGYLIVPALSVAMCILFCCIEFLFKLFGSVKHINHFLFPFFLLCLEKPSPTRDHVNFIFSTDFQFSSLSFFLFHVLIQLGYVVANSEIMHVYINICCNDLYIVKYIVHIYIYLTLIN